MCPRVKICLYLKLKKYVGLCNLKYTDSSESSASSELIESDVGEFIDIKKKKILKLNMVRIKKDTL